jgi:hypothetical protein
MTTIQEAFDWCFGIGVDRAVAEFLMCYPNDRSELCGACGQAPWDCSCTAKPDGGELSGSQITVGVS